MDKLSSFQLKCHLVCGQHFNNKDYSCEANRLTTSRLNWNAIPRPVDCPNPPASAVQAPTKRKLSSFSTVVPPKIVILASLAETPASLAEHYTSPLEPPASIVKVPASHIELHASLSDVPVFPLEPQASLSDEALSSLAQLPAKSVCSHDKKVKNRKAYMNMYARYKRLECKYKKAQEQIGNC